MGWGEGTFQPLHLEQGRRANSVSSGRDMAADGSLRASRVGGTGLRQGWFAPEPPSKVLGRQRGVFRESPVYANQCGDE